MPNTWADFPLRKDSDGHPLCRKCGTVLTGRHTAWCGSACLKAVVFLCDWSAIRRFILRRDKYRCQVCRNHGREVDHIIEVQDGGMSVPENLRCLCHRCHVAKTKAEQLRRLEEKRLRLLLVPGVPDQPAASEGPDSRYQASNDLQQESPDHEALDDAKTFSDA